MPDYIQSILRTIGWGIILTFMFGMGVTYTEVQHVKESQKAHELEGYHGKVGIRLASLELHMANLAAAVNKLTDKLHAEEWRYMIERRDKK